MNVSLPAGARASARVWARAAAYWELTKPRITLLVGLTALTGFVLGGPEPPYAGRLAALLVGTALAAGGANALNMALECDADARMRRTRRRPIPSGRLNVVEASTFGAALSAAGTLLLALTVNPLTALLAAATIGSYVLVYTPLKRRTPFSPVAGAVPGALPIVGGWAATGSAPGLEAWLLFAIMFLWQLPHFLALAWMYREDYARGGFSILPALDPEGRSTARQILLNTLALLPVTLAATIFGLAGPVYFFGALGLGGAFLGLSLYFAAVRSNVFARRFYLASVIYLPVLLALMVVDRVRL